MRILRVIWVMLLSIAVPFVALIGGVWFLYLAGYNLSVATGVGFIALAGVSAEFGVVMLLYLKQVCFFLTPFETENLMKKFVFPFVLAAALPGTVAFAQKMDDMKPQDMAERAATPTRASHQATGVVKKLDAKTKAVTIAHDPIRSLNWPAMTMVFKVKDKTLLDKLSVGKKVEFEFVQSDEGYIVTAIK